MMGTKTLREIRDDFERAIREDTGEDPIVWLEKQIATRKRKGQTTDVYEAVKHVFERLPAKKTGGRAPNGKPRTAGKRPDVLAELEAVTRALERAIAKKPRTRKAKAKA
jgi:hypothetical protein